MSVIITSGTICSAFSKPSRPFFAYEIFTLGITEPMKEDTSGLSSIIKICVSISSLGSMSSVSFLSVMNMSFTAGDSLSGSTGLSECGVEFEVSSVTVNFEPLFSSLSTVIEPFIASTNCFTSESPIPEPIVRELLSHW